jgi:ketosteroid isomerase-like protein
MAAAATVSGPRATFKPLRRAQTSRCALLAAAVAASWVWLAVPALAQSVPKVRIVTGAGDFLVDLRPAPTEPPGLFDPSRLSGLSGPSGAEVQQKTAASGEEAPPAVPPVAMVAEPTPEPDPARSTALAPEPALSAQPAQDAPATSAPAAVAAVAAVMPPAGNASSAESAAAAVRTAVRTWADAWAEKDLKAYFASYGEGFAPADKRTRKNWEESRRARITGKSRISVTLSDLAIAVRGGQATARFKQHYSAGALNISSRKMLALTREAGGRWVIVREATGR